MVKPEPMAALPSNQMTLLALPALPSILRKRSTKPGTFPSPAMAFWHSLNTQFVVVSKGLVVGDPSTYAEAAALAKKVAVEQGLVCTVRTLAQQKAAEFNTTPEGRELLAKKAAERQVKLEAAAEQNEIFRKTKSEWLAKFQAKRKPTQAQISSMISKSVAAYLKANPNLKFVPKPIWRAQQGLALSPSEVATIIAYGAIS
jgi:hypothetical protein